MKSNDTIGTKKSSLRYSVENITPASISRLLIMTISVANMIWMPIYTEAILLLEDQICGFIMFCYILGGLVALFGATRMDCVKMGRSIFTGVAILVTIVFGVVLNNTMMYALYYQASLRNHQPVVDGINFNILIYSLYGVSFLSIIVAHVWKAMKDKKAKQVVEVK